MEVDVDVEVEDVDDVEVEVDVDVVDVAIIPWQFEPYINLHSLGTEVEGIPMK